ncbi:MAG: hypothetical protein AABN34_01405 [Acidobacteriota bacterium]
MRSRKRLAAALIILSAAVLVGSNLIDFSQKTVAKPQELQSAKLPIRKPPVTVIKQRAFMGLDAPVQLLRPAARLSAENQLEEYTCIVKNNSEKAIVAYALAWHIITETAGKESSVRQLQVSVGFIHPDVQEAKSGVIAPGAESPDEAGPTYFESNASVKRLGVSIDYVEFEDGTSLGPNLKESSSQQIAMVREGASRYKEWLGQIYAKTGRSPEVVLQQLQSESIPDDLDLSNAEMKQGANVYRTRMLKQYNTKGPVAIQKILQ